jgi:hypothetical protein
LSYLALLNERVTVYRRDTVRGADGRPPSTFTSLGIEVPMSIQRATARSPLALEGEWNDPQIVAFAPRDADILLDDRVLRSSGQWLRVASVSDAAGRGHHIELELEQVADGA